MLPESLIYSAVRTQQSVG